MNLALEPLVNRRTGFSPASRYSCLHSHSHAVHPGSPRDFTQRGTLPYPAHPLNPPNGQARTTMDCRGVGGVLKPRYIVGAEPLDQ